jgi:hypothetical protein
MNASFRVHIALSFRSVAPAFEISHSVIKGAQLRDREDPLERRRHYELETDSEQELSDWIANEAINNMAVNETELLHEWNERFWKKITRGWVNSFVKCHREQLVEIKGIPRTFPEAGIEGFQYHIHNSRAELVLNFDEIEISEWEDRTEKRVIMTSTMRGQTIFQEIHQNLKHTSIVACISSVGEHMTSFFVCSQANETLERRIKTEVFRIGVDLTIKRRSKP